MGKKQKPGSNLGRSLIKDRFGSHSGRKYVADNSMLHTTEIKDGYDWARLNLQSVTEESSFQEFLSTAQLTGTEFQTKKLNIKFVNPQSNVGLLSGEEMKKMQTTQEENRDLLKIPRRPKWDSTMSREQLDLNEREYFLEWRRRLAQFQENEKILLTPYEKNLEFWRQLWRVVERSDVIVQIVDARNPLLFRCEDLEKYVHEVSKDKMNLILVNKADFLTDDQRQKWAEYFTNEGVRVVFYSAVLASEDCIKEPEDSDKAVDDSGKTVNDSDKTVDDSDKAIADSDKTVDVLKQSITELEEQVQATADKLDKILSQFKPLDSSEFNSNVILSREGLIDLFKKIHTSSKVTENITTIGLVGYPNVGKSSTINSLLMSKKVSVSATPGKTKHFQTLYLDEDILLCDCPGLVMPSFVFTKAEMVINGILPIDQMRDHVPPVNLVANLIPRHVLEDMYGIMIPLPIEGEDPDRCPTSEELLNAYAYNRGFMTANGQPDNPRAARYILKDYMNGKLLYCHAPPGVTQEEYHQWPETVEKASRSLECMPPRQQRAMKLSRVTTDDVDKVFFQSGSKSGLHIKGKVMIGAAGQSSPLGDKPWKKINKHENKNKREKLRRVYAHLDQH